MYVINPVGITSIGRLSQLILDMLWSEPFCICKLYVRLFKRTEIALTVLLLHPFTLSKRAVNVTKPDVVTLVGRLSPPILDMLWSEPFCIREMYVDHSNSSEIILTVLLLHHFTFSNRALAGTQPVMFASLHNRF